MLAKFLVLNKANKMYARYNHEWHGFHVQLIIHERVQLAGNSLFCLHGNHSFPVSIAVYPTSILLLSREEEWMNLCVLANPLSGGRHTTF